MIKYGHSTDFFTVQSMNFKIERMIFCMRTRIFVLSMIAVMVMQGLSSAAVVFDEPEEMPNVSKNFVEQDPKLPPYNNPIEFDVDDGQLHLSFKGVFRLADNWDNPEKMKLTDDIAFVFVATPKKDMKIRIEKSELFDGKARRFEDNMIPRIGDENEWNRELIEGIPIRIYVGFNVPSSRSSDFPAVSRVNIRFNGQWVQFRNVKTKEWALWEKLRKELDL